MSDSFKKERRKAQKKAWRDANKESIAIRNKTYRKANKESISIKKKAYYEANRESILVKKNAYYLDNIEAVAIRNKTNYESHRLTHHIVYCLPYYDKHGYMSYAGVTDAPNNRMLKHENVGNNIDDWFILQVCETRQEALKIEAEYHEKGYAGKKGFINNLKQ